MFYDDFTKRCNRTLRIADRLNYAMLGLFLTVVITFGWGEVGKWMKLAWRYFWISQPFGGGGGGGF